MKSVIAAEAKRAESLIEGYLSLPPDSIDLELFNPSVLNRAPKEFAQAVAAIQAVAAKSRPSQADAAYAVNVVDLMAEYAQRPRLSPATQKLWAAEQAIRESGVGLTLRHLVAIVLAIGGIVVGGSAEMSIGAQAYAYAALAFLVVSGALSLSHSRNAEINVPFFSLSALIGFCVITEKTGANVAFLALLATAVFFMVGTMLSFNRTSGKGPETYEPQLPPLAEYNPYVITEGNDMSEPLKNLQ
ncbi:hypothetical protein [Pseudomonas sp. LS-2]|uniref:hypothetical protein n=1 Tax=Pseudomonas sp. LS-2 TaxID=2315859 RepID=UPI000E74A9ED|nr:hypothetical protein [Pseudomonas sp. LS-2]RJX72665.1 hypothetical protein D3M70_31180 [Pseudomonas sp. LS-2]